MLLCPIFELERPSCQHRPTGFYSILEFVYSAMPIKVFQAVSHPNSSKLSANYGWTNRLLTHKPTACPKYIATDCKEVSDCFWTDGGTIILLITKWDSFLPTNKVNRNRGSWCLWHECLELNLIKSTFSATVNVGGKITQSRQCFNSIRFKGTSEH